MKMPDNIENIMLAPCGVNCMVCYKHLLPKKSCQGCNQGDGDKPQHCLNCSRKNCDKHEGNIYCFQCKDYPCVRIKSLDKTYSSKYNVNLIQNAQYIKENGMEDFMRKETERWTCPNCGGIISQHDATCSECKRIY